MRTGEIVDLANERRLSAVLNFARWTADVLILNGGSKAEEFAVLTSFGRSTRHDKRSVYCIDSGTSMHVRLPFPSGHGSVDLTVQIVGEHGSMVLRQPSPPVARRGNVRRIVIGAACAVVLAGFVGGRLDSPQQIASADPEPPPVDAPLVSARVSLTVPAHLPRFVFQPAHDVRLPESAITKPPKRAERRVVAFVPVAAMPFARHVTVPQTPAPRMTDLRVPSTAKSGDFVQVHFGAVGRQVKIIASIGPTVVSKTVVTAQQGTIAIKSPRSDRLSRIMTVRAYAQDGKRSSTLQAIVVLVHP